MSTPRHAGRLPDLRPLDRLSSIKIKLGVLVTVTVTLAAFITWIGLYNHFGPTRTLPIAIAVSVVMVQVLAHGMTAPLREMRAAARAMAEGDYSQRVRATSRDEVGQLAEAFNTMAQDLEQVDTLRREMVANVSHELRTPVAALRAQLENMVDGVSEPDTPALEAALAQTERLGRLVTYLLDLSRIEAGAVGLEVTEVPLAEFLEDAAAGVRPVAAEKDVTFSVAVDPSGLTVPADAERLHQVVANLLHNAVRHSPGGGEVQLAARRGGGFVVIDVVDQGPGIPPAHRQQVFERFHRGNAPAQTGQTSTGGTGLGLAIVRWAVELHGGQIQVADSPTGCVMRVSLPAQRRRAATVEA
ncbi:HAMP domain-containing histidine kinase [Actinotalea sp. BY-33]|uniref:Signal transduction histidine-protein kinase/phosphatase MprB n=1 Tax=Actinotalea soli TaxID=2819234 RepID=A0A939LNQ6_9CELL|nr:ATP-binding protein [Actinotalea soli]MBO1750883.1 HAMP domain-containing histidine kinase [Actinotalea soli]